MYIVFVAMTGIAHASANGARVDLSAYNIPGVEQVICFTGGAEDLNHSAPADQSGKRPCPVCCFLGGLAYFAAQDEVTHPEPYWIPAETAARSLDSVLVFERIAHRTRAPPRMI
jgi:hypothetical protein